MLIYFYKNCYFQLYKYKLKPILMLYFLCIFVMNIIHYRKTDKSMKLMNHSNLHIFASVSFLSYILIDKCL